MITVGHATILAALRAVVLATLVVAVATGPAAAYTVDNTARGAPNERWMIAAPDGSMWATGDIPTDGPVASEHYRVWRFSPGQQAISFPLGSENKDGDLIFLGGMTVGADGRLWIALENYPHNGRVTFARVSLNGKKRLISVPGNITANDVYLAAGPDGNIWFTGVRGSIGRLGPTGRVRYFHVRRSNYLNWITQGPDGALWATGNQALSESAAKTLRITTRGHVRRFNAGFADNITLGPDGNIWLSGMAMVQRITPHGQITKFPLVYQNYSPDQPVNDTRRTVFWIAPAADGNMVFTAGVVDGHGLGIYDYSIGQVSPAGVLTESNPLTEKHQIGPLIPRPDNTLFGAGFSHDYIVTPDPPVPVIPAQPRIRRLRASHVVRADLRCNGIIGTFCAGTATLRIRGKRIGKRHRYALAPFNRLYLSWRLPRVRHARRALLTVTSKEPYSGVVTTVRRSVAVH